MNIYMFLVKNKKKKEAYKEMKKNPTEKNNNEDRRLKKYAKKAVARAMKEEAVKKINELGRNPNNVYRLVRKMKIEITDCWRKVHARKRWNTLPS